MTELQALRTDYRARKARLLEHVASPKATARLVRKVLLQMADLTDDVLRKLWEGAGLGEPHALLAVGGPACLWAWRRLKEPAP